MAFMDFLFGNDEKTQQFQRFTPQQQQLQGQLLGGVQNTLPQGFEMLQNLLSGSPEALKAFQAPAMRQFQEDILPSIAERFTGMDGQKSNAFGQQLGKAGAGLAENLSAQKANLGTNALTQLQGLLGGALTPSFENIFRPGTQGFVGEMGNTLATLLPLFMLGM